MIPVKVYLEVNKDLVQLFDGILPTIPRIGERAHFPYKKSHITAKVINVVHNFVDKDVSLTVEILEDVPSLSAGTYFQQQFN